MSGVRGAIVRPLGLSEKGINGNAIRATMSSKVPITSRRFALQPSYQKDDCVGNGWEAAGSMPAQSKWLYSSS